MGTEILRPQYCLIRPVPNFRKPNPNANSHPKPFRKPSPEAKKRREGSPKPTKSNGGAGHHMVMGQVTILKRGESLPAKAKREEVGGGGGWDPAVFGPDRLGPDPALMPKQIRLVACQNDDGYAGLAFSMSPSPRSLPLPSFSRKEAVVVDYSATKDLRRLLRLD